MNPNRTSVNSPSLVLSVSFETIKTPDIKSCMKQTLREIVSLLQNKLPCFSKSYCIRFNVPLFKRLVSTSCGMVLNNVYSISVSLKVAERVSQWR